MTVRVHSGAAQARFIAAILVLAGIWLAMLVTGGGPLDRRIYELLYAGHRPALAAVALFFTVFGEPTLVLLIGAAVALWLWWGGRGRLGGSMVLVMLLGRGLVELQKYWIARVRPDFEPHLVIAKSSSFPSGHAANSMIVCLTLALGLTAGTRWQRPAVIAAVILSLLIGASRVLLGVHWPSDVVGGWAFGMLWVFLTLRPAERLLQRRSTPAATPDPRG